MGSQTPRCTVERRRGQAAEAPDEAEAAKAEKEAEEEAEEEAAAVRLGDGVTLKVLFSAVSTKKIRVVQCIGQNSKSCETGIEY